MSGVRPPAVLHCYLVLDTSTRLLYVPHVGDRKYIIMKGSVDGGVYYRIHERERLSFGKICFYGVRTH